MLHIAFYISALRKGGAERVMLNLIEHFKTKGYRITLVTQYHADNEYPISSDITRIYSDITKEEETSSRIVNFCKRYKKLRAIWKSTNPDVILSFIGMNNIMTLLTTRRLHIPVAVAVRGDPKEEYAGKKLKLLCKWQFKNADALILQTKDSVEFFEERAQKKAVVLKNPLSIDLLKIALTEKKEKRIVTSGRLDANKNQEGIIIAFSECLKIHPEYRLSIYGDGEDRTKLEKLADELEIKEKIEFTGSVSDVWNRMNGAEIFILNSYTEGMPNALLEAMALGMACISTDCPCGGPRQIIENGLNGLLIEPGNTKMLTEKMLYLMDNPVIASNMGMEAVKVRDEYEPGKVLSQWEAKLIEISR